MISEKMRKAIEKRLSFGGAHPPPRPLPPDPLDAGVPTLKPGIRRKFSPMLRKRFEEYGRWERATHATWLSLDDMASLWEEAPADPLRAEYKLQYEAAKADWPNHATALFRDDRLTLFAVSDLDNESVVLLWLDFEPEPEVWVYDANGESRFRNLEDYLDAYLGDEVSAARRTWRP